MMLKMLERAIGGKTGTAETATATTPKTDSVAAGMARGNADAQASDRMLAGMAQPKPVVSPESMDVGALGDKAQAARVRADLRANEALKSVQGPKPDAKAMLADELMKRDVKPQASHATKPSEPDFLRQDVVSVDAMKRKGLHMPGESTPTIMQQLMEILKGQELSPEAQALRTAASQRLRISGVTPKPKK